MAYVALLLVVFAANAVPAFAPPTWTILVWFELRFGLNVAATVALGVVAATSGRALLATYMHRATRWMPRTYVENMRTAGDYITRSAGRMAATFAVFFVSPLSSAQLFAAAGIMGGLRLVPLLTAFALGRCVTYTLYVTGANIARSTDLGDVLVESMKSPWGIAAQVIMVAFVILPGLRRWNHNGHGGKATQQTLD